jgi:hypothetical protein
MAGKLVDDSALARFWSKVKAYFTAGSNISISNGVISGNYSNATTSAAGLMSSTDKTAVNKIGTGTLNTTNKTLIPAVNELASKSIAMSVVQRVSSSVANNGTISYTMPVTGLLFVKVAQNSNVTRITGVSGGTLLFRSINYTNGYGDNNGYAIIYAAANTKVSITVAGNSSGNVSYTLHTLSYSL